VQTMSVLHGTNQGYETQKSKLGLLNTEQTMSILHGTSQGYETQSPS